MVPLYSYRDVFNDGPDKLHPGFRLGSVLLCLTNTKPKKTPYVELTSDSVQSDHFKAKGSKIYLTSAYNQEASRFNDVNGGFLILEPEVRERMSFLFNLPNNFQNYLLTNEEVVSDYRSGQENVPAAEL